MGHNLLGERFVARIDNRTPAWHGLGQTFTGPMLAVPALEAARADEVTIRTWPLYYRRDGEFCELPEAVEIVREPLPEDPNPVPLGHASASYTLVQNRDIAELLDAAGLTARFPVETLGVLGKGETIFISLDMGEDRIAGDDHKRYVLITDTRDGGSALKLLTVYTRVVCQNTLIAALREDEGVVRLSLEHTATLRADLGFGLRLIQQLEGSSQRLKAALEHLHSVRVSDATVRTLWPRIYPDPAKGQLLRQYERVDDSGAFDPATLSRLEMLRKRYQDEQRQVETLRATAAERYGVLCAEAPTLAGTALGVFNAVAEVADHTRNGRSGSAAALFGHRADEKLRGFRVLSVLA
jgi:phage/plasmid-like protein (TIGR03299 family)